MVIEVLRNSQLPVCDAAASHPTYLTPLRLLRRVHFSDMHPAGAEKIQRRPFAAK